MVFEATVEVFVWEDNRVEYNHLRGDVYVTAWGEKARQYSVCVGAAQSRGQTEHVFRKFNDRRSSSTGMRCFDR